jgi:hypothetical protein
MVLGRWALPDVDGVLVEKVLDHMAERMRPAKGTAWDSLAHRKADALVELCRSEGPRGGTRSKPLLVIHTKDGESGGEIEGMPIAEETVQLLRQDARVVVEDDDAPIVDHGPGRKPLPVALERELRRRDLHCRYPGCERTRGLQGHHLVPVTWGGHTHRKQVVYLCPRHHRLMEPHGNQRLVGDPDLPDGLRVLQVGAQARAGPAP